MPCVNETAASAFYVRAEEDVYVPSDWTRGPWGPDSQHAGPPAALLGRALAAVDEQMHVTRIAFDILKPVPVAPLRLTTRLLRPGGRVQLVEVALSAGDDDVMGAIGWLVRAEEDPPATPAWGPPPGPDHALEGTGFPTGYRGYLDAMEWRFVSGSFLSRGPATAWLRMRVSLVEGEEISPLERVLAAVDSASGISGELDFGDWVFINPDLVVSLHRLPETEWVCLDASTVIGERGTGAAYATIYDERGAIGSSMQSLFLTRRS